jgi:hypothetical protein
MHLLQTFGWVNEYLFYISGFFYYFSATVNPILYNLMSLKYRYFTNFYTLLTAVFLWSIMLVMTSYVSVFCQIFFVGLI